MLNLSWEIAQTDVDSLLVDLTVVYTKNDFTASKKQTITLRLPRPVFTETQVSSLAEDVLKSYKMKNRVKIALEDLFVEAWMKHLRSRLVYWTKWWYSNTSKPLPLDILIGTFVPKCHPMGDNSLLRLELRKRLAE